MRHFLLLLGLAVALSVSASIFFLRSDQTAPHSQRETPYDRILRTGKIRCGYIIYPPNMGRDPNTGAFFGISYDIMTRIAKDLGLSLDWVEETSPATMVEGLRTDRYDLLCTNVWASAARGTVARFSNPLYFTAINAYARTEDSRFAPQEKDFNTPALTIATIDGGIAAALAHEDAPKAKLYSMPELTDFASLLLAVHDHKADLTFSEEAQAVAFDATHPQSLRNLTPDHPVRLFANAFLMKIGDDRLASMLNNAITTLQDSGFIDQVLAAHAGPKAYRSVAKRYQ